jgi:hypothetical protein
MESYVIAGGSSVSGSCSAPLSVSLIRARLDFGGWYPRALDAHLGPRGGADMGLGWGSFGSPGAPHNPLLAFRLRSPRLGVPGDLAISGRGPPWRVRRPTIGAVGWGCRTRALLGQPLARIGQKGGVIRALPGPRPQLLRPGGCKNVAGAGSVYVRYDRGRFRGQSGPAGPPEGPPSPSPPRKMLIYEILKFRDFQINEWVKP